MVAIGTERSVPLTLAMPPSSTISAAEASSMWLAILSSLVRSFRAAIMLAPPAITSERLAKVPQP